MTYDYNSPQMNLPREKDTAACIDTLMETTIEKELDSLTRMVDEYEVLSININETKRRLQEMFESGSTRLTRLFEKQMIIERGEPTETAKARY